MSEQRSRHLDAADPLAVGDSTTAILDKLIRTGLQARPNRQPVQGWMGTSAPFTMGPENDPHHGIRPFLSGTPSIAATPS